MYLLQIRVQNVRSIQPHTLSFLPFSPSRLGRGGACVRRGGFFGLRPPQNWGRGVIPTDFGILFASQLRPAGKRPSGPE